MTTTRFMMMSLLVIVSFILVLRFVNAKTVSDEARKHWVRGQTAMEMAKVPADYQTAIQEFQKARDLAPDWPEVYLNLADAQEKAGKFKDAQESLTHYLKIFPESPRAAEIRDHITRLEFRAEQEITEDAVLEIFGSLGDKNLWVLKSVSPGANPFHLRDMNILRKEGSSIFISYWAGLTYGTRTIQVAPIGKLLNFYFTYYLCDRETQRDECPEYHQVTMEIVSKRYVKVSHKYMTPKIEGQINSVMYQQTFAFERK